MKYPWKEVSPGTISRPLDNSERFLKAVATPFKALGRENWALSIVLSVAFTSSQTVDISLRQAWLKLRYFHPFIAAQLHLEENIFTYSTPSEEDIHQWLSDSFFVHHTVETVDGFLLDAQWTEYSSLHYFPSSSEILMRTHHWLVDGTGALHLANRFLELYAAGGPSPKFGDEARFLPPCLLDAAGFPSPSESQAQHSAQSRFMDFVENLPSIGLPIGSSSGGPGGTRRKLVSFPPDKLDKLLRACRTKRTTIAAAVHAAVAIATQEKAYNTDVAKKFTTVAFFDYRKYLPEPYNDVRLYPMGVWMLGLPFSLRADLMNYEELLDVCKKVYKQPVARDVFPMFDSYEAFCGMMADAFGAPPSAGVPLPSQPQLSSIGLVDRKIQREYLGTDQVSVQRVELVVDSMVTTPVIFQWSFDGTLYLNACYNDKWQTGDFMEAFLGRVGEVLMEGMGVG